MEAVTVEAVFTMLSDTDWVLTVAAAFDKASGELASVVSVGTS